MVYVALCTGYRDNIWGADAWEHYRDIRALARNVLETHNPTYATSDQTPRYSPYIVFWGAVCHFSGIDPYTGLSIAAVANTLLLALGVLLLLRAFGEGEAATCVLLIMVGLYGGAPNHSGSYALADLPWHQVNPSSFTIALTLILWAMFVRLPESNRKILHIAGIIVLGTTIVLSHALIGGFALLGMLLIAVFAPTKNRFRTIATACGLGAAMGLLCFAWPWYSFLSLARNKPDATSFDWFNPAIMKMALFQWDAPAALCALAALTLYRRKAVRVFLLAAAVMLLLSVAGLMLRSVSLYRLPVVAILCLHIPVGIFAYQSRLFQPRSWGARLRALVSQNEGKNSRAILETLVAVVFLYFLLPQLSAIMESPHLARAYLAHILHKEDKQVPLRKIYAQLLSPIHEGDVVLSDPLTMWPVPSYGGRVVLAFHGEALVKDEPARRLAVHSFFTDPSDDNRREILSKYKVRWIILNRDTLDHAVYDAIFEPSAVVNRSQDMVLLDVNTWMIARKGKHAPL
jgi:hypothetical protein